MFLIAVKSTDNRSIYKLERDIERASRNLDPHILLLTDF